MNLVSEYLGLLLWVQPPISKRPLGTVIQGEMLAFASTLAIVGPHSLMGRVQALEIEMSEFEYKKFLGFNCCFLTYLSL